MAKREVAWASSPAARTSMQGNRSRDTGLELAVRRALFADGFRYRVDYKIPNQARRRCDIAFTRAKVAVFLDGCFWHRCAQHYVSPKLNFEFWEAKTLRNVERDRESAGMLEALGWEVLRFWEHEDSASVVRKIEATVRRSHRRLNGDH